MEQVSREISESKLCLVAIRIAKLLLKGNYNNELGKGVFFIQNSHIRSEEGTVC
jgi:hypothetical protein